MKNTTARLVVNLVQKVLPLVPNKLWPVPENRPPPVDLGSWINTTQINNNATTTWRTVNKVAITTPGFNLKLAYFIGLRFVSKCILY